MDNPNFWGVGRGRHPRGGSFHGGRLQHRGVLPRQGHILADVGCPRESEDDLDHRNRCAAMGQVDLHRALTFISMMNV